MNDLSAVYGPAGPEHFHPPTYAEPHEHQWVRTSTKAGPWGTWTCPCGATRETWAEPSGTWGGPSGGGFVILPDGTRESLDILPASKAAHERRLQPLTDDSKMPFGKHKGLKMRDVPAAYLHWVYTMLPPWTNARTGRVHAYIEQKMQALKGVHPDGSWLQARV